VPDPPLTDQAPRSPFAAGRLIAGRYRLDHLIASGGMAEVWQAADTVLGRPVAVKILHPHLAADDTFVVRFRTEAVAAARLHHPGIVAIYDTCHDQGSEAIVMELVRGPTLRARLDDQHFLSPDEVVRIGAQVADALGAAHRAGLVHRDIKPANVMIARSDEENEDHIYLTDFGIARRTDGESLTRTGMFVGTVDYMAPERIEGGKGEAPSDIYSLGCVLFEALTGHVPFDKPTDVSKIFAHINDPIPSARDEVDGVPEQLDAIITKAMAKHPEDRFGSAGELAAALGQALQELETAERVAATPKPRPDETDLPTVMTEDAATAKEPAATRIEPAATRIEPAATRIDPGAAAKEPAATRIDPAAPAKEPVATRVDPAATRIEPIAPANEPAGTVTEPKVASPPPESRVEGRSRSAPSSRRSPFLWLAPLVLLSLAGVLIATFSDDRTPPGKTGATSTPTTGSAATQIKLQGGGLTAGRTIGLSSLPGWVSVGRRNVWISLPDRGELVRFNVKSGTRRIFPARGRPTALAAGSRALWVAQAASRSLAEFDGDSGAQVTAARLPGSPVAIALDQDDSSAWVADSSGAISHVAIGGAVIGTPAHSDPSATSIAWGEGWLWAANGAADGLVRLSLDTSGSSAAYPAGQRPVAVTVDQGVWIASANGHVTRFDPRTGHLRVNADIVVAPELDAIAATDPGPFVWAISKSQRTVYRVTNTSKPAVTGTIVFGSPPVALAVNANSVWVATQDGKVTQIRF
jgi:serine/threonine protein kinase